MQFISSVSWSRKVCEDALTYFYGKMYVYMVIYRSKDKSTTQDNLVELIGSPVAQVWYKLSFFFG